MTKSKITIEHVLFFIAGIISFFYHVIWVNNIALTEVEAHAALQAALLAGNPLAPVTTQPLYTLTTGFLFSLFGETNFLARLIPLLCGSLLVFLPYLFRNWLGKEASILLSFMIAFDPGLASLSRQAEGPLPALVFLLLTAGLIINKKRIAAGVALGIALCCGVEFWSGLLSFGLVMISSYFIDHTPELTKDQLPDAESEKGSTNRRSSLWQAIPKGIIKEFLLPAGICLVVIGTFFLARPQMIGGVINSFLEFLKGWGAPYDIAPHVRLLGLVFYQPLAIVLAASALWQGFRKNDPRIRYIGRWLFLTLLVGVVYPSGYMSHMAWVLVPLWALAAIPLLNLRSVFREDRKVVICQTLVIIFLLVFAWLNFLGIFARNDPEEAKVRLAGIIGAIVLGVLVNLLVSFGWGWNTVKRGMVASSLLILAVYGVFASIAASGLGTRPYAEIWRPQPVVEAANMLSKISADISLRNQGWKDSLDLWLINPVEDSLAWSLRDYRNKNFVDSLPADQSPALVITNRDEISSTTTNYSGESLVWTREVYFDYFTASQWLEWFANRKAASSTGQIYLWARTDLFNSPQKSQSLPQE